MKYQIIVEKIDSDLYMAHCPSITNLRALGYGIDSVLHNLHRHFLCYLHDPEAEMEIIIDTGRNNTDYKQRHSGKDFLAPDF